MKGGLKKLVSPLLQRLHKAYFSSARSFEYNGIKVEVMPGVFPPHFTLSTSILIDFLKTQVLNEKTFLEVGCGSGIIAIQASKQGAKTTAIDINPIALKNTQQNAERHGANIEIINSDLFDDLKGRSFDMAVINPPYYPKKPANINEKAWFCGEEFEYFQKFFKQLHQGDVSIENIYMILSEDCDIQRIKTIAEEKNCKMTVHREINGKWEKNYLFTISL